MDLNKTEGFAEALKRSKRFNHATGRLEIPLSELVESVLEMYRTGELKRHPCHPLESRFHNPQGGRQ